MNPGGGVGQHHQPGLAQRGLALQAGGDVASAGPAPRDPGPGRGGGGALSAVPGRVRLTLPGRDDSRRARRGTGCSSRRAPPWPAASGTCGWKLHAATWPTLRSRRPRPRHRRPLGLRHPADFTRFPLRLRDATHGPSVLGIAARWAVPMAHSAALDDELCVQLGWVDRLPRHGRLSANDMKLRTRQARCAPPVYSGSQLAQLSEQFAGCPSRSTTNGPWSRQQPR